MADLPDPPFVSETEDTIRTRLLDGVDDSFNKEQGDIVYDLLTPVAMEIDQAYDAIEIAMDESFAITASGGFLDALALQFTGLVRDTDETDTLFRVRVLARLQVPKGAGNVGDWATWALAYTGVGYVTIQPVWAGAGTVRVLAAGEDRGPFADTAGLATYLAPFTPIGATLTVDTLTVVPVTVMATLEYKSGFDTEDVAVEASENLAAYFDTLNPADDVIYNEVVAAIMEAEGVFDITSLTIQGVAANLVVASTELANFALLST